MDPDFLDLVNKSWKTKDYLGQDQGDDSIFKDIDEEGNYKYIPFKALFKHMVQQKNLDLLSQLAISGLCAKTTKDRNPNDMAGVQGYVKSYPWLKNYIIKTLPKTAADIQDILDGEKDFGTIEDEDIVVDRELIEVPINALINELYDPDDDQYMIFVPKFSFVYICPEIKIVMEKFNGSTLWDYLFDADPDQEVFTNLIFQTLFAVVALNASGIYHNDLHPLNIMIDEMSSPYMYNGRDLTKYKSFVMKLNSKSYKIKNRNYLIKLIDFGLTVSRTNKIVLTFSDTDKQLQTLAGINADGFKNSDHGSDIPSLMGRTFMTWEPAKTSKVGRALYGYFGRKFGLNWRKKFMSYKLNNGTISYIPKQEIMSLDYSDILDISFFKGFRV